MVIKIVNRKNGTDMSIRSVSAQTSNYEPRLNRSESSLDDSFLFYQDKISTISTFNDLHAKDLGYLVSGPP